MVEQDVDVMVLLHDARFQRKLVRQGIEGGVYARMVFVDAGDKIIEANTILLDLSVRVATQTLHELPYLNICFGKAARDVLAASTAHLLYVCRMGQAAVIERVRWDCDHCSARGMPRWVSEFHLAHVIAALMQQPANDLLDRASMIQMGLRHMAAVRRGLITDADFERIAAAFDARLEGEDKPNLLHKHLGRLFISAWADFRTGVPEAMNALRLRLAQFSPYAIQWCERLDTLVNEFFFGQA